MRYYEYEYERRIDNGWDDGHYFCGRVPYYVAS